MSDTLTIEVQIPLGPGTPPSQCKITVPLSAIGAASLSDNTNKTKIAQFTAETVNRVLALNNRLASPYSQILQSTPANDLGSIRDPSSRDITTESHKRTHDEMQGVDYLIHVKCLDGNTHTVRVNGAYVVDKLKELIQAKAGIPCDQQRIIFKGKQVGDSRTLAEVDPQHSALWEYWLTTCSTKLTPSQMYIS